MAEFRFLIMHAVLGMSIGHLLGTVLFKKRKTKPMSDAFELLRGLELEIGVERVEGYNRERHEELRFRIRNSPGLWGDDAEEFEQLEAQWRTLQKFPPKSWWK